MQHIRRIIASLTFFLLFSSVLSAQNIQLTKGYYINQKGEKIIGFFDTEYLRDNNLKFWTSETDNKAKSLDIADVEKVVFQRENRDTLVLLTQTVTFQEKSQKIYLEYFLKGDVNLLGGVSQLEKDIFFIYSTKLPKIRRINGVNPKTFLFAYFPKCEKLKKTIREIYYERSSLEKAIRQLANCDNIQLQSMESPKIKSVKDASYGLKRYISLGITGTGGYAFASMDPLDKLTFKAKSVSTGFGASLQVNLTNRLSLAVGVHYSTLTFSPSDSISGFTQTNAYTGYSFRAYPVLNYKKKEYIPIEIKYRFIRKNQKIEPIVSLGFMISQTINPQFIDDNKEVTKVLITQGLPPSWYSNEPPNLALRTLYGNKGFGAFATLGFKRQITDFFAVNCGAKYTLSNDIIVVPPSGLEIRKRELFNNVQRFDIYTHLLFTIK